MSADKDHILLESTQRTAEALRMVSAVTRFPETQATSRPDVRADVDLKIALAHPVHCIVREIVAETFEEAKPPPRKIAGITAQYRIENCATVLDGLYVPESTRIGPLWHGQGAAAVSEYWIHSWA